MDDKPGNFNSEMLECQETKNCSEGCFDMSNPLWSTVDEDNILLPLEVLFSPVRDCAYLPDHVNSCGDTSKELENFSKHSPQVTRRQLDFNSEFPDPSLDKELKNFSEHSSQVKRRRLDFYSEFSNPSLDNVEISPTTPPRPETPPNVASSIVVYPFSFIKPSSVLGVMTLEDVNRRINTSPQELNGNGDDPSSFPTSSLTGKPIISKTRFSTGEGRGSITITRSIKG